MYHSLDPIPDEDLSPRTRRAINQLNATAAAHAKLLAEICAVLDLEPVDVAQAQRNPSDLAAGPRDQDQTYEMPREGTRTPQQWV
eukprot:8478105-Alexandrium_andersonii.AAC.1